jgi:hypothetical protein
MTLGSLLQNAWAGLILQKRPVAGILSIEWKYYPILLLKVIFLFMI